MATEQLRAKLAEVWAQFYYDPEVPLAKLSEEQNRHCYEVADEYLPVIAAELAEQGEIVRRLREEIAVKNGSIDTLQRCNVGAGDALRDERTANSARERRLREALANHVPMIAITGQKKLYAWLYCSCGFNREYATHTTDPAQWPLHIDRALLAECDALPAAKEKP